MVYSAAWRQTGDADLAEEAAQAVFVLLTRKALHLRGGVIIAGWLYRTACLTARRALRDQTRRRIKDREAVEMRLTDSNNEVWSRLEPHLDAALANLGEADRTAIVLRFLERRSFRDVAATLNLSEVASKKRVSRALEKLRIGLTRQGVTLGVSAIAAALLPPSCAASAWNKPRVLPTQWRLDRWSCAWSPTKATNRWRVSLSTRNSSLFRTLITPPS
jgi:RNA polymerase sigma factor (sigma-70 family)